MADKKDQIQNESQKRKAVEQARQQKGDTSKQVPYENRQLTPGRDGQTLTR